MTEKELAKVLKSVKKYFEPRENYGWDARLKSPKFLDDTDKNSEVVGVYAWKNKCYLITADGYDTPMEKFPCELKSEITLEVMNWLKEQSQTPKKYKK